MREKRYLMTLACMGIISLFLGAAMTSATAGALTSSDLFETDLVVESEETEEQISIIEDNSKLIINEVDNDEESKSISDGIIEVLEEVNNDESKISDTENNGEIGTCNDLPDLNITFFDDSHEWSKKKKGCHKNTSA